MVVSFATWQHVLSASAFVAWVMPTAPGVNDATFASEPEPTIHVIDSNVTGIENAARKMPITAYLQTYDRNEGRKTRRKYLPGVDRITPPCFACAHSFLT